jgi:hypothetical protein
MQHNSDFMETFEKWQLSLQRKRPKGTVVYLGPAQEFGDRYFMFQKDGVVITVGILPYNEAYDHHNSVTTLGNSPWKTVFDPPVKFIELQYDLHTIQAHIKDIDWSADSNVTIVGKKNGTYHVRQINSPITGPALKCPAWMPLVDERAIEPIYWSMAWYYVGLYNGIKVDVQITCNETSTYILERWSENVRMLQSLGLGDLVYPVLGHVVRHGETMGIMCESVGVIGHVTSTDMGAVCHALTLLQQHHIIHTNLQYVMLARGPTGSIRFLTPQYFTRIEDEEELEEAAEVFHWGRLDEIMTEMSFQYNPYPVPNPFSIACSESFAIDIPETPAVPRMLFDSRGILREFEDFNALFKISGGVRPSGMGIAFLEVEKDLFPQKYYFMPL